MKTIGSHSTKDEKQLEDYLKKHTIKLLENNFTKITK